MVIEVDRFVSDADTTISRITVDGEFIVSDWKMNTEIQSYRKKPESQLGHTRLN